VGRNQARAMKALWRANSGRCNEGSHAAFSDLVNRAGNSRLIYLMYVSGQKEQELTRARKQCTL